MGGCISELMNKPRDCQERGCVYATFLPKNAPEWYKKKVGGFTEDVHIKPAPPDSVLLLGHISLNIPELDPAMYFFTKGGFTAGRSLHEPRDEELRANFGPSQLRFPVRANQEPQLWPGEITLWVDDVRGTADMFNMLGPTFGKGRDIVKEYAIPSTGGEFLLKIWDPWFKNTFCATEPPRGFAQKIRALGHDISESDAAHPAKVSNSLALSDVSVNVKSREQLLGVMRFYDHFLMMQMTGGGPTQFSAALHFGPGDGLHQTITFNMESSTPSYSNLGSICLYIKDFHKFILAHAKCKVGAILVREQSKEELDRDLEFSVRGIVDPQTHSDVVPLVHVIRHASHPECPLR